MLSVFIGIFVSITILYYFINLLLLKTLNMGNKNYIRITFKYIILKIIIVTN